MPIIIITSGGSNSVIRKRMFQKPLFKPPKSKDRRALINTGKTHRRAHRERDTDRQTGTHTTRIRQ